jgi:hypothetical protein
MTHTYTVHLLEAAVALLAFYYAAHTLLDEDDD